MPKIAHLGDLHINKANRFEDTLACLDFAISDGIAQGVDLWVCPGDLFDTKSTPEDRNALAAALKRMAAAAPVVVCYGNHDKPGDLDIFELLETHYPIRVLNRPDWVFEGGVKLFVFPHFDKSNAAAALPAGMALSDADDVMVQAVRFVLDDWAAEVAADHLEYPLVMMGHLTIAGSILSNGEPHPHQGVSLNVTDLADLGLDAVMLNHIHKAQVCDAMGRIRYAGSISRANFGESQDPKGWWLWDIAERGAEPFVQFREVPARAMLTFSAEFTALEGDVVDLVHDISPELAEGAEVRVRITFPEDRNTEAQAFADQVRRDLAHAHYLQVELKSVPVTRVRAGAIAEAQTPEQKLVAFWGATERPDVRTADGVIEKLGELRAEVA